jgi:hypothetical protein
MLMIFFVINDTTGTKPVEWKVTFSKDDKSPYGLQVLFNEMEQLFPDSAVEVSSVTPYQYLLDNFYYDLYEDEEEYTDDVPLEQDTTADVTVDEETYYVLNDTVLTQEDTSYVENEYLDYYDPKSFLIINPYAEIDDISCDYLLDFVSDGNAVMIASYNFPNKILDSLYAQVNNDVLPQLELEDSLSIGNIHFKDSELKLTLANKNWDAKSYTYNKGMEGVYFSQLDSIHTTVLGYHQFENTRRINFVKIQYGDGFFYLHTQPFVFTNYNLLKSGNATYAAHALSYLPDWDIIWDDRATVNQNRIDNPLRYLLSQPALRWAWYIALLGVLFFIIFKAKRRQRIVPIIEKLPNTSIDFAKTIGNLYYQQGKPQDIVNKKITFFLEHIRNTYLLDTQNLNDDFKKKLQSKTGMPQIEIERLVDYIIKLNKLKEIPETSLVLLHNMIDNFYKQTL